MDEREFLHTCLCMRAPRSAVVWQVRYRGAGTLPWVRARAAQANVVHVQRVRWPECI